MWFCKRKKPKVTLVTGLPGSGKTTLAQAWVAENPHDRVLIDDPRDYLAVVAALNSTAAAEVMITDPMLVVAAYRQEVATKLQGFTYEWIVLTTTVEECVARVQNRGRPGDECVLPDIYGLAKVFSLPEDPAFI